MRSVRISPFDTDSWQPLAVFLLRRPSQKVCMAWCISTIVILSSPKLWVRFNHCYTSYHRIPLDVRASIIAITYHSEPLLGFHYIGWLNAGASIQTIIVHCNSIKSIFAPFPINSYPISVILALRIWAMYASTHKIFVVLVGCHLFISHTSPILLNPFLSTLYILPQRSSSHSPKHSHSLSVSSYQKQKLSVCLSMIKTSTVHEPHRCGNLQRRMNLSPACSSVPISFRPMRAIFGGRCFTMQW